MNVRDAIAKLVGGWKPLSAVPYEELFRRYAAQGEPVWNEFVRRLAGVVYRMAVDHCIANEVPTDQQETRANELKNDVFEEFAPEFGVGAPRFGLRRFAGAIRQVLSPETFDSNALLFYNQMLVYYLDDDDERRYMEAHFSGAMAEGVIRELAGLDHRSEKEVENILQSANENLERVRRDEFGERELAILTEGNLS